MTLEKAPPVKLNTIKGDCKKVLFLGYNRNDTTLIDLLIDNQYEIWHTVNRIKSTVGYDLLISYGYRYIFTKEIINSSSAPIVNLHISYLPFNRGAHPNFWSFYENTPSGVSIHLVDEGIDTGSILFQKRVYFKNEEKTFSQTHKRLIFEIETLFKENIEDIIEMRWIQRPQIGMGTYHKVSDLPKSFPGWDAVITDTIERFNKSDKTYNKPNTSNNRKGLKND